MQRVPRIFVSATSGDLRTLRQVVKEALLTRDCHPVEQTNFAPDARTVAAMLRGRISGCQALIHIAGLRYGAEPDPATLAHGARRRSYTQLEYDIGRELQAKRGAKHFRVYTFVCPEDFPYDTASDPEPAEKQSLQQAHRADILGSAHLYELVDNAEQLQSRLHVLQEDLHKLRAQQTRTARLTLAAAALILLALVGVGYGVLTNRAKTDALLANQQDERALLEQIIDQTRRPSSESSADSPQQRYDRALTEVAFKHNLEPADVRAAIDAWGARVSADPKASAYDRALVEYRAGHFERAAIEAATAYDGAMAKKGSLEARKAARLEGDSHRALARYDEALTAYRNAAALTDRDRDPLAWADENHQVAAILHEQAKFPEAEPLLRDVITIRERHLPPDDPFLGAAISTLAFLLEATNRHPEAEPLLRRAVALAEAGNGRDHPKVADSLINLAQLLKATNRMAEAELLYRRALANAEGGGSKYVSKFVTCLNFLARLLKDTDRAAEAEPLFRRALEITEANYGSDHPRVADSLNKLADLLNSTKRPTEAEPLMRRALEISESKLGKDHPDVARDSINLAFLLAATNRHAEAEPLLRRGLAITEATYGKDHPKVASSLINLAQSLKMIKKEAEAESLYRRALAIAEAAGGKNHPQVATCLDFLAKFLEDANRPAEAEPLYRRALEIAESSRGDDHPEVATRLNKFALFLKEAGRLDEAETVAGRSVAILLKDKARNRRWHPDAKRFLQDFLSITGGLKRTDPERRSLVLSCGGEIGLPEEEFDAVWQELTALGSARPAAASPAPSPAPRP